MTSYKSNKMLSRRHFTYLCKKTQIQVTFTKLFQSLSNSRNFLFIFETFLAKLRLLFFAPLLRAKD